MINNEDSYDYSYPISVSLTTPGKNVVQVQNPYGVSAEYCIEMLTISTADSSVYIMADNYMLISPSSGAGIAGYLISGVCSITSTNLFSDVNQSVSIVANVGATNAAINVVLRFRRTNIVHVPQDIEHPSADFSEML